MPFHLITGIPGHGKTSLMMEMLAEAVERNNKHLASGKPQLVVNGQELIERPLYAAGIDGLVDGLVNVLEDPTRWQDLPDGSLIFVDECWKWFGHLDDARGKPPPHHVQGIAEHRHKGMDFIGTSQGPRQIYPFMRPLIGPHWHVVRRFGSQLIDVYKWGELAEDPQSQGMRERGEKQVRTLPTKQRPLYKSASAHTIKTKIPKKVIVGALVALLALPIAVFAIKSLDPRAIAAGATGAPETAPAVDGATTADGPKGSKAKELTPEEYAAQLLPRIAGVHGSQPIFDGRQARTTPATYCVISGAELETKCRCYTEQVTRILDVTELVCREWARYGRYDPYRGPPQSSSSIAFAPPPSARPDQDDGPRFGGVVPGDPLQIGSGKAAGAVQGKL